MKRRSTKPVSRGTGGARARGAPEGAQAVSRALSILLAFDTEHATRELGEISAELGLNKTTTFRLLGALERERFVVRDGRPGAYRLGPALIALGARARRANDLHRVAHAVLEELAAETGETATLEILVGDEVLIVDEVHGRFLLSSHSEIGTRWPAHAASTGKALLAANPEVAERVAAAGKGLPKLGPNTIRSRARLMRELEEVRRRGFAIGLEEIEPAYTALGAPIRGGDGSVVAAISIGGPTARLGRSRLPALGALVRAAADRISEGLGAPAAPALATSVSRSNGVRHARTREAR